MRVLLFLSFAVLFSACTDYEPIFGTGTEPLPTNDTYIYNFVYIYDNDLYITDQSFLKQRRLTTDGMTKTHCTLSQDLGRIAYIDHTNTPIILDTAGTLIERLDLYPSSNDLVWFDNTLLILQFNELHFYGDPIQKPDSLFTVFPSNSTYSKVDAIAIDNNGNMAYTYRYQGPYSSTSPLRRCYSGVAMSWADSSILNTGYEVYDGYYDSSTKTYEDFAFTFYHDLHFNPQDLEITLSYVTNTFQNNGSAHSIFSWNYFVDNDPPTAHFSPVNEMNAYKEKINVYVGANDTEIKKNYVVLPVGVIPQIPGSNAFIISFDTPNDTIPTFFDFVE